MVYAQWVLVHAPVTLMAHIVKIVSLHKYVLFTIVIYCYQHVFIELCSVLCVNGASCFMDSNMNNQYRCFCTGIGFSDGNCGSMNFVL